MPALSIPRAFGVARDELAHSRVLAELLDPARHAGAEMILRSLLHEVSGLLDRDDGDASREIARALEQIAEGPFGRVAVHRESMLIDVVVELSGPAGEAVVGIENKIDAGEQPEQIARYQATLARVYPGRGGVMGFLTPTGRAPTSAAGSSTVPTVALSYEWLAQVLSEARRTTLTGRQGGNVDRERDGRVLLELEEHVRREILGEGKAGPEDHVRELWREYGRALRLAMKHRPRLADIREEYLAELEAQFPGDASVELWGKGCDLREIKMNLRSWDEAGFSFTLMLRAWGSELPQVQALVWKDRFRERAEPLAGWARRANASLVPGAEPLIEEFFTPVRHWTYWHRIFREEDYPDSAEIADNAFDEETVQTAVGAVVALVELLRPHVEPHLGPGANLGSGLH